LSSTKEKGMRGKRGLGGHVEKKKKTGGVMLGKEPKKIPTLLKASLSKGYKNLGKKELQ